MWDNKRNDFYAQWSRLVVIDVVGTDKILHNLAQKASHYKAAFGAIVAMVIIGKSASVAFFLLQMFSVHKRNFPMGVPFPPPPPPLNHCAPH